MRVLKGKWLIIFHIPHLLQEFIKPLVDAVSFEFIFQDGDHHIDQWEGAKIDRALFISAPNYPPPVGIKEG